MNYYVWTHKPGNWNVVAEGPWGPYTNLANTRIHARIKASRGKHDVAITTGPPKYTLVRLYAAGTGETLVRGGKRVARRA